MIANLPNWINILFVIIVIVTISIFHLSNGKPKLLTFLILVWSIGQSSICYNGFYQEDIGTPPRFLLVFIPSILMIIYGLLPKQIEWVTMHRNTRISTFLHLIRVPIEIILLNLFFYKMIPQLMTFQGRNFDIIIGLTAPIIGLLYWKNKISKKVLLIWNIIGLAFVLFIFINGILSSELPFQQFGFEQPNKAVIYFPFVLLPATVVPIVIYTHITDIIKLNQ